MKLELIDEEIKYAFVEDEVNLMNTENTVRDIFRTLHPP